MSEGQEMAKSEPKKKLFKVTIHHHKVDRHLVKADSLDEVLDQYIDGLEEDESNNHSKVQVEEVHYNEDDKVLTIDA